MSDLKPPKKGPSTDELLRRWEADKKKSLVFLQLAEEYRKQDFVDAAISVLREGIKIHPNSQAAQVQLARCLMAKRELSEAEGLLQRIRAKHPDNILAGKLLAEVLDGGGRKQAALDLLKKLVPFAPDDAELPQRIAMIQADLQPASLKIPGASEDTSEFHTGEMDIGRMEGALARGGSPLAATQAPHAEALPEPELLSVADIVAPSEQADLASETTGGSTGEMSAAGTEEDDWLKALSARPTVAPAAPPARRPAPAVEAPAELPPPPPVVLEPARAAARAPVPAELLGPSRPPAAKLDPAEDDFTSLTLAELYESQGVHAEALAIYERLLARRPGDLELQKSAARCRVAQEGLDTSSSFRAAVETPAPVVAKPRWQPVRPVSSTPPTSPVSARSERGPLRPSGQQLERLQATRGELERWLAACRAVRQ